MISPRAVVSITIIVTVFTSILAAITILTTILVTILIPTLVNIIINNVTFFFIVVVNILSLIVLAAACSARPSYSRRPSSSSREGQSPGRRADGDLASSRRAARAHSPCQRLAFPPPSGPPHPRRTLSPLPPADPTRAACFARNMKQAGT